MVSAEIRLIIFFAAKDGEALYSQQKQHQELTLAQIMNSLFAKLKWFSFKLLALFCSKYIHFSIRHVWTLPILWHPWNHTILMLPPEHGHFLSPCLGSNFLHICLSRRVYCIYFNHCPISMNPKFSPAALSSWISMALTFSFSCWKL